MVREKKYICGRYYMDVAIYNLPDSYKKRKYRNSKQTITSPHQRNLNDKRAKRYFRQLVHTNFAVSGYHLTLTYSDDNLPVDLDDAKRLTDNFIRRLRNRLKKTDNDSLKYIVVDERTEKGRIHHHIIIDCCLSRDEIEGCWRLGRANCDKLQPNERGLAELCAYMQKSKEEKDVLNPKCKRRWRASKNLKKPVETTNDNKYNKRKLAKFAIDFENKRLWEKQYPNWEVIEVIKEVSEYLGESIYIKFKKKPGT